MEGYNGLPLNAVFNFVEGMVNPGYLSPTASVDYTQFTSATVAVDTANSTQV